jgi:hypothetical protein
MVALPHLDAQLAAGLNFEAGNSTSMASGCGGSGFCDL